MITKEDLLGSKPLIIAGPCAVESREGILAIARSLKELGANALRTQLWKPRSEPGSFQGVGEAGLEWLLEVKAETGLPIATEVVAESQIEILKGVADILWVGARNMQNFELLKVLGKDDRPVILKRGFIATLGEWMSAAKYIGKERVIMCERGIRSGSDAMRFTLDLNAALVMRHDYKMPVIVDPSHTAGRRDMVPHLALAAIAAGLDGIVVEVHNEPEKALTDAKQQIDLVQFQELMEKVRRASTLFFS